VRFFPKTAVWPALRRLVRMRSREGAPAVSALFDADWYLARYSDVAASGMTPLEHFLQRGVGEGRDPNPLFSTRWYLDTYPDVALSGENPLEHFLLKGSLDGRDPNPLFSTSWYLEAYPDVAASGMNPLEHFLGYGAREGRDPGPLFNTSWYLEAYPDVAASGMSALEHYLRRGAPEGRECRPPFEGLTREARIEARALIRKFQHLDPALADLAALPLPELMVREPLPERHVRAWRKFYLSLDRAPRRLILAGSVDEPRIDRLLRPVIRAAHEIDDVDATLVLVVDMARAPIGECLPKGTAWRSLAEFEQRLTEDDRVPILTALLNSLQPEAVLILDSEASWRTLAKFGMALSRNTEFFAMLPGPRAPGVVDASETGLMLPDFVRCAPFLAAVYAEDRESLNDLAKLGSYSGKLHSLPRSSLSIPEARSASSTDRSDVPDDEMVEREECLMVLANEPGFLAARRKLPATGRR
jgi:hypothetical protein